jgi:putative effector of murein hydrolase
MAPKAVTMLIALSSSLEIGGVLALTAAIIPLLAMLWPR